jgi:hypothetical protein
MKNFLKLISVVLVSTFLLVSCGDEDNPIIKNGGTIQVTNGLTTPTYVIIAEGTDYNGAVADLTSGGGSLLLAGKTQEFKYNKDGVYTVVAMPPAPPFTAPVTLLLGGAQKVTVK